jgi:hypothetical protein
MGSLASGGGVLASTDTPLGGLPLPGSTAAGGSDVAFGDVAWQAATIAARATVGKHSRFMDARRDRSHVPKFASTACSSLGRILTRPHDFGRKQVRDHERNALIGDVQKIAL